MDGGLLGGERERIVNDSAAKSFLQNLKRNENKHDLNEAYRLFFLNETDFLGGVYGSRLIPSQGFEETLLIGKLKYQNEIFARLEEKGGGLALLNSQEGWLFNVRTDCSERGFFYEAHAPASGSRGLDVMTKRMWQINTIIGAIQGYEQIVHSRRLEKGG